MKFVLRICALALLLLVTQAVTAGVEPMLSARKRGPVQLQVNQTVVVTDDKYSCLTTSSCSPAFTPVKQEGSGGIGYRLGFKPMPGGLPADNGVGAYLV